MNTIHNKMSLVIVDVETTGLSFERGARVCEIGAVKIINGKIADTYQSLINPQCIMPYGAYMVHGISDEMLAGAPTFREIAIDLEKFIQDFIVGAYNTPFDRGFINSEFSIAGSHYNITKEQSIDILVLARRYLRGFASYSLPRLAQTLGINTDNAHRALGDVKTAWKVFKKIIPLIESETKKSSAKIPAIVRGHET